MNIEGIKAYNNLYEQQERKKLVAEMLLEFRKTNSLQQKEVAELIGIKAQTYCSYESGRTETPIEILVRLAILYDVPIDILVQRHMTSKNAQDVLNEYDTQIQELRQSLLQGSPEAKEAFSTLVDGLQNLTDALKEAQQKKD